MKSADRKKLEKLALERLDATANDEERWSFLFRTDGAVGAGSRGPCRCGLNKELSGTPFL
jgi:hypothetical protein